ncbi:MAG: acyl-CoA dehydrogenase family protein [Candidatus Eisenbacteria bacterium]
MTSGILHLTEEQLLIRDTARDFAEKELVPHARAAGRRAQLPLAAVKKLGELGFLGMMADHRDGAGLDSAARCWRRRGDLARLPTGVIMSVNNSLNWPSACANATDEQKEAFLKPPLASGRWLGAWPPGLDRRPAPTPATSPTVARLAKATSGW